MNLTYTLALISLLPLSICFVLYFTLKNNDELNEQITTSQQEKRDKVRREGTAEERLKGLSTAKKMLKKKRK